MNNLTFDSTKHHLGSLCARGHEWKNTGKSLRSKSNGCLLCQRLALAKHRVNSKVELKTRVGSELEISLGIDLKSYFLGNLTCSHDYKGTGFALRRVSSKRCPECESERVKRDRQANPEKFKERGAKFYAQNREKVLARQAKFRGENLEHVRERSRLNTRKIRATEKYRTKRLEWLKERRNQRLEIASIPKNIDQWLSDAINMHRSRAKKSGSKTFEYTLNELKCRIFAFNGQCAYCDELPVSSLDHFITLSKGGENSLDNILPCCECCNSSKSNRDPVKWYSVQYFFKEQRLEEIFNLLGYSRTPST
jgi:5-methylcytosine-specific restriction endonuclease McrA